jgi:hypothetical protein
MSAGRARQLARLNVDDETWCRFRQTALQRDVSVATYLGELVERELRRRGQRPLAELPAEPDPADAALVALADVRQAIDELDDIAGRLARSAVTHGGSWRDVATSLRIAPEGAERAYRRRPERGHP